MSSLFDDYAAIAASGLFDGDYYLSSNPDVAALNYDPLMHYLELGAREMRNPNREFDAQSYVSRCRELGENPENPLLHFIRFKSGEQPQAAATAPEPEFLVGLDRASRNNGSANGGGCITGEGWVVARQPIVEVAVAVGRTSVTARYGLTRIDVAQTFPQYPRSEQSGFAFTVDGLWPEETEGSVEIVFAVRTVDGKVHSHSVLTYLTSTIQDDVPVPAAEQTYRGLAPLKLEVDSSSVDKTGVLRIVGWAVCFAPIVTVQVYIDDERIGAAHYGQPRQDVGLAFPDYPGASLSGFTLTSDVGTFDAGGKTLRVEAIASTGISREVVLPIDLIARAKRAAPPRETSINVFNDAIELSTDGWLVAEGWALCPSETQEIIVELNGIPVGSAEIGRDRPDVGNLFPAMPHARRSGFAFRQLTLPVSEGEHMIVLRVRDIDGAEAEIPLPVLARPASERLVVVEGTHSTGSDLLKFNIDLPLTVAGAMANPVRGNLEIAGWAVARNGIGGIDIAVDGEFRAAAFTGVRRLDVFSQFGDWPGALTSGFTALLSHRSLPIGSHTLSVTVRDAAGNSARSEFSIEVEEAPETLGPWSLRGKMALAETDLDNRILASLDWNPRFALALAVPAKDETALRLARQTLASLAAQTYPNMRVLVLPQGRGAKEDGFGAQLLDGFPALAGRVDIVRRPVTTLGDILDGEPSTPSYFMALKPGDELGCDALVEFAVETGLRRGNDFLYADDRRTNPVTGKIEAFFKPDWSPDLLLSTNYIGRAWCASDGLIARTGMTLGDIAKSEPFDLVLRLTEFAQSVGHVSSVLFQGVDGTPETAATERSTLRNTLTRRGIDGTVEDGTAPGIFRVKRKLAAEGLVSIIIPTCATRGLIKTCLDTLRAVTTYRNFEIVCIENIPADQQDWKTWLRANADVVIETTEPFNWSRFNNLAVAQSRGEFLLFLNDDIEIIRADWLDVLLEHAQRPEVGVVGPQLLYPDGRVQHAGMFLAGMGIARHAFRYMAADDPGYFGLALTQRNVISVTGACLLTRRETFEAIGRFDETHTVVNNDLDYCLRVWRAGLRTIYTPHTTLIHHEQASRIEIGDIYDASAFESQWSNLFVAGDPFFNRRLSKERDDYSCEWEPVQILCSGHPVFDREKIEKILIVKLDHIGDCVTALPAVRRLKRYFPKARLHVLSSRASKSIWTLEPAVDEIIEFDFFHARSSLGTVERTEEDWQVLAGRLAPYGFDLAVDLRKHIETRPVLLHTGARYLAGYDHKGRYPWLDVALEWSEDQASFRKRQHAADDLTNLVDAIAAAAEDNREMIVSRPRPLPKTPWMRKLFKKPVVCVHPAAGNDMKQWPAEYFALLINQLVELEDVHIALVGGPDDEAIASAILDNVDCSDAVWSLVGKLKLAELPDFIATCALFVGNDSGPKHIAAGLGVPTVGIHSGIVDSREWGPIGALAIGIDRDMTCSPCYRSKLEDCHRALACLRQILPGDVHRACKRLLSLSRPEATRTLKATPT
jgi:ADP-heptose:LPS heptosyltransferase/GT2 family glycosyltransferase